MKSAAHRSGDNETQYAGYMGSRKGRQIDIRPSEERMRFRNIPLSLLVV